MVLEKTLETLGLQGDPTSPSKGDQSWVFIGRTDAEAETPIIWPPHAKSWLTGKDPDDGRDWGQEEKGSTEDEMAGWHHYAHDSTGMSLNKLRELVMGREAWFAVINGVCKESDTTEWLNWTELIGKKPGPSWIFYNCYLIIHYWLSTPQQLI